MIRGSLNFESSFDRWTTIPPIFVPPHVSNKHVDSAKRSLFELLSDAVRAYVAGAPAAAIAVCRSALEIILRDHYLYNESVADTNLSGLINLAVARYEFLSKKKLHEYRRFANNVLHDYTKGDSRKDEKMILSFLSDLKLYIEKAPLIDR